MNYIEKKLTNAKKQTLASENGIASDVAAMMAVIDASAVPAFAFIET